MNLARHPAGLLFSPRFLTYSPFVLHSDLVLLLSAGLIAGLIDSIAGGGGLITVPVFSIVLGAGPGAIGTNKIAGATAAFVALVVYAYKRPVDWKKGWLFTVMVALGAWFGSSVNPWIPLGIFRWLLLATCPIILWIVWNREWWIEKELQHPHSRRTQFLVAVSGLACGFYDGVWGPGGGTFMLLSLLMVAGLPLFPALAACKLANTCSALVSLVNYAIHGYVHWQAGFTLSAAIGAGAFFGSWYATKRAARIIRPVLVVVVALLLAKLALD